MNAVNEKEFTQEILSKSVVAYDELAARYEEFFPYDELVGFSHDIVRQRLMNRLPASGRVLEVGGGTGRDALWIARQGYDLYDMDISPRMLEATARRFEADGIRERFTPVNLPASQIDRLVQQVGHHAFDGAYSFYGALNSEPEPGPFSEGLAKLLKPKAYFVAVVYNRFCPVDIFLRLIAGQWGRAVERLRPWFSGLVAREMTTKCYAKAFSPGEFAEIFKKHFRVNHVEAVGLLLHPKLIGFYRRHPRLLAHAKRMETRVTRWLPSIGNDFLIELERL